VKFPKFDQYVKKEKKTDGRAKIKQSTNKQRNKKYNIKAVIDGRLLKIYCGT